MSIFSNSYKYLAYVGTSDLIPLEDRTDTLEDSILQAGIADDSISGAVQYGLATDMGARGKSMIRYASKPDGYIRGLPTSDQPNFSIDSGILRDAIERDIGEPIDEAPYLFTGGPEENFLLNKKIQEAWLDPTYFPWPLGDPTPLVWDEALEFVEIPVVDPVTGNYYVTENNPQFTRTEYAGTYTFEELQEIKELNPDLYATLTYTEAFSSQYTFGFNYTDSNGDAQTWESPTKLDLTVYEQQTLIHVKYITAADSLHTQYWVYVVGSNADPELESAIVENTVQNNFYPVIILMQDKVWFNEVEGTELEITTNRICRKMLSSRGDSIREDFEAQEAEDDASGDSGKINAEKWDFMIHFAAPVLSNVRATQEYLYLFFLEMEKNQQYTYDDYQTFLASRLDKRNGYALPQPISEIRITEGGVNGYNVRYGWSYIFSKSYDGRWIGHDGQELKKNRTSSDLYERKENNDAEYRVGLDEMHGTVPNLGKYNDPEKEKTWKNGYHDYVIYTYQYYDEDNDTWSYTRVLCMGLSMEYTINTSDTDTGKKGYRFRYAEPRIFDINPETLEYVNAFRIPIHIGIVENQMKRIRREALLQDSLSGTVFLVDKVKVPWYSTGFFKWLIIIIAIILIVLIIVFSMGSGAGLVPAIISAVGATGIWAMVLYVVLMFAFGFIIALAGQLIGGTAGLIFTIVGSIVMMQAGGPPTGTGAIASTGWGSAISFMSTTLTYVNFGLQVYHSVALAKLEEDMRDFMKTAAEKAEELREAWAALGEPPDGVNTLDLVSTMSRGSVFETADSYFNRTLNANPGLLGYDYINNFTGIALTLPESPGQMDMITGMLMEFERQRGAV